MNKAEISEIYHKIYSLPVGKKVFDDIQSEGRACFVREIWKEYHLQMVEH